METAKRLIALDNNVLNDKRGWKNAANFGLEGYLRIQHGLIPGREGRSEKKILLLGPAYAGKSTVFKQYTDIHGDGWTHEDKLTFIDHIHAQVIEPMKLVLKSIGYLRNYDAIDDSEEKQDPIAVLSSEAQ